MIGFCGLRHLDDAPEMEGLCDFAPAHWGWGSAMEAATMLRYAFEVVGLDRLLGIADEQIVASRSVLEKLGMNFEQEGFHEGR